MRKNTVLIVNKGKLKRGTFAQRRAADRQETMKDENPDFSLTGMGKGGGDLTRNRAKTLKKKKTSKGSF